jgi:hypothetical protein
MVLFAAAAVIIGRALLAVRNFLVGAADDREDDEDEEAAPSAPGGPGAAPAGP